MTSTGNITTAGVSGVGIVAYGNGGGAVTVTSTGNITAYGYRRGPDFRQKYRRWRRHGDLERQHLHYGQERDSRHQPGWRRRHGDLDRQHHHHGQRHVRDFCRRRRPDRYHHQFGHGVRRLPPGSAAGIFIELAGTNTTLTNLGPVTALSGLAIKGNIGNDTVNNFGTVIGNVMLGTGTNAFNNMAGGQFNSGATVSLGTGNTLTNAGTLSPGGAGTILTTVLTGNLVQTTTGRLFADINIAGATSDRVNVSGTANLAGAVQVQVQNLILGPWQQTVLSATGGTTNNGLSLLAASPACCHAQLIYPNATDVALQSPGINFLVSGLNGNQTSLANALNGAAQSAGLGRPVFNALLTGVTSPGGYSNALTQLSGEAATGAQGASFQLTRSFLALLTGPTGGPGNGGGPAMPFAPERADAFPSDVALAYASVLKAPVYKAPVAYEPRWSSWGRRSAAAAPPAAIRPVPAPSSVSAHTGAVRGRPRLSRRPRARSLAWRWPAARSIGRARGPGSAVAAATPSWPASTAPSNGAWPTSRARRPSRPTGCRPARSIAVAGPDTLTPASFNAQNSLGGRLEGGYRVPAAVAFNVTPYAAVQAQDLPFAGLRSGDLRHARRARSVRASHVLMRRAPRWSAHGIRQRRFDKEALRNQTTQQFVNLFGRLAWAHDWQSNPNLTATFIGLPTATFVVNGAAPPSDLALITAGAEWRWRSWAGRRWPSSTANSPAARRPTPAPARSNIPGDRRARRSRCSWS